MKGLVCSLLTFLPLLDLVSSHAIFWEPPSRASLGKHSNNFCNVPVNDDHMSVYCGGIQVQHMTNNGKCGICGDPWNAKTPSQHPHKVPGKYATGIIGRSYFEPGQVIDVIIDVVANHKGFFAFRLCPNNNPDQDPEPECFEKYPLYYEDGSQFYFLEPAMRNGQRIPLRVKLPDNLVCWQCILQWNYVSGNNWGIGPQTPFLATEDCIHATEGKMGCGPQETFRGCADICIGRGCPKEYCQRARPFTTMPPNPEQICIDTGILPAFYSELGQSYCEEICLNKPMKQCNSFICYCNTAYITQRGKKLFKN